MKNNSIKKWQAHKLICVNISWLKKIIYNNLA